MSSDPQDQAEALDSDKLGDTYPPDTPLGAEDYGTTPAEERVDEPLEERVARDRPDTLDPEHEEIQLVAEPDPDTEAELLGVEATPDPRNIELDEGDPSERLGDAAVPAEEQAVNETR
ncbi:MAG TPA: hypothetical protein VFN21_05465 [Acidimicrobiales bacterium]|nr:hypothetical protein [Acidimicrobiales bacterium]